MKIAVIGHKRVPSREGGIEKSVEKQMLRLRERGHEVILYDRSGHNIFGAEFDAPAGSFRGMKIVTVPTPGNALGVPVYSFLATVRALREKCDILYYHGSGSCLMIPLARLFGARCVGMIHGIDSQQVKWNRLGRLYLRMGEKAAARRADACLVLSESIRDYIREKYGKEPVLTCNGTEPPCLPPDPEALIRKRFGLEKDGYILCVVRIVAGKGLEYLIRAFRACGTEKKLVIAGGVDPVCRDYYAQLRELAAGDERILFTGFLEEPAVQALYLQAYAFVFPSDHEGMAHSLLEAMAAGCCCLVSDIPENTAVIREHGLRFRRGDADDLREKLQGLLDDPGRVRSLREGTAAFALRTYDWDAVADQLEEVFGRALSTRTAG